MERLVDFLYEPKQLSDKDLAAAAQKEKEKAAKQKAAKASPGAGSKGSAKASSAGASCVGTQDRLAACS